MQGVFIQCSRSAGYFGFLDSYTTKCFSHFQRGDYRTIGAMSIVQGGPGFPIFSQAVLDYFSQGSVTGVQIELNDLHPYLKFLCTS